MSTRTNDPDDELPEETDVEETDLDTEENPVQPDGTPQVQVEGGKIGEIREPLPPGTDDPNWVDPNVPTGDPNKPYDPENPSRTP